MFCYILPCCKTRSDGFRKRCSRGAKKGPLIFRCAVWCLLDCCSRKLGKHLGALEQQPQGHGPGGRGGPFSRSQQNGDGTGGAVPRPSAAPNLPASLVKGICLVPLLTHGAGMHGISGPMSSRPLAIPPTVHRPSLLLLTSHPSHCPLAIPPTAHWPCLPVSRHRLQCCWLLYTAQLFPPLNQAQRSTLLYRQDKARAGP